MANHARSRLAALHARARDRRATLLTVTIALIAAGLAAYTAAASYDTVSHLAAGYGVALPRLNPLGIDGGVAGLIIFDIALTWSGDPIWWLRMCVRGFAVAMIAANAAAGWPSAVGTGLRVAAPVLFVIIIETGRTVLLRRNHAEEREKKAADRVKRRAGRIPRTRWLLDFRGTFALWKRMRLWREPSYSRAVSMELERLAAIEKLAMQYGPEAWQEAAPADLVWMLKSGVRMAEALQRVAALIEAEGVLAAVRAELDTERAAREAAETERDTARAEAETLARKLAGSGSRKRATATVRKPGATTGRKAQAATAPEAGRDETADVDREALVLKFLAEGYSASRAGIKAGLSDSRGRQIARNLAKTAPQGIDGENQGS